VTPDLTPRQWDVVRCVGRDLMSYKRAGHALGISPQTVAHHAAAIRDRIEADRNPKDACILLARRFSERVEDSEG